jgi:hypothetical protein
MGQQHPQPAQDTDNIVDPAYGIFAVFIAVYVTGAICYLIQSMYNLSEAILFVVGILLYVFVVGQITRCWCKRIEIDEEIRMELRAAQLNNANNNKLLFHRSK